jgi:CheY-like chemotaxis protein
MAAILRPAGGVALSKEIPKWRDRDTFVQGAWPRIRPPTGEVPRQDWAGPDFVAPSVLVIDDDPDIATALADVISRRGYRAATVRDGREIMIDLSRIVPGLGPLSRVDVLVVDFAMPRSSGLEVLEYARANAWPVAIVIISAFANHELQTRSMDLGAKAVLNKPFAPRELVDVLERIAPLPQLKPS